MSKTYSYRPREYLFDITIVSAFTAAIFLGCVGVAAFGHTAYTSLLLFIALVAGYSTWNTFVSHSNPSEFIIEEDGISFCSYGRVDKYNFDDIKSFQAKDFRGSGKIYIRVNKSNMLKGRYWLHTARFNDSQELFLYILRLEYKTHPHSLKSRAWDSTRPNEDKSPIPPWLIKQAAENEPEQNPPAES